MKKVLKLGIGFLALISTAGMSVIGCSANGGGIIPIIGGGGIPNVTPATVAAIINLVAAFNGFKGQLTSAQLAAIQNYLSGTKSPDIMIILSMLATDGVIPTANLSPAQMAAILALLDSLGFMPVVNGSAATAKSIEQSVNLPAK